LEFRFTNQISVFDQIIPSLIPRKGETLNRTTAHWFKLVEEAGVCVAHTLVEVNGPDRCLVRKVEVIKEPGMRCPGTQSGSLCRSNSSVRHYLAGSAWRRFQRGDIDPGVLEHSELRVTLTYGMSSYQNRLVEVTTKFEAYDRNVDREEALANLEHH
jgi:phosphoribosylaminoimidazole-succinocarboxamide synthase